MATNQTDRPTQPASRHTYLVTVDWVIHQTGDGARVVFPGPADITQRDRCQWEGLEGGRGRQTVQLMPQVFEYCIDRRRLWTTAGGMPTHTHTSAHSGHVITGLLMERIFITANSCE